MLELKNIKKTYQIGELETQALKGINIEFRKSEFVAILGPSGCGKTTLLNIVGGLDQYTSGDLIINNKSTKEYKDKDWDTYRNHLIGFVFQSYNLIPHLTVLENVELALTLSGVSKQERRLKAANALKEVGLGDKLKNKPNQLSGGQMQRVAIARAIVNDPEIILADEPTGALDTESSIQVMNILKEISNNRLVVMVTHNPDLADKYANRIIRLLDGNLIGDSNPYNSKEETNNNTKEETKKKKKMSFFTALSLSFKNLLTKKGRTILVCFAGSIGIIGIALILSISSGFNTYVNKIQEDALSSYPITIESKSADFTSIITSLFTDEATKKVNHEKDAVYSNDSISKIMNTVGGSLNTNNLTAFTTYLNEHNDEISKYVNAIQYTYDIDLGFYDYTDNTSISTSDAIYKMIAKYSLIYFAKETNATYVEHTDGSVTLNKDETYDSTFTEDYPSLVSLLTTKGFYTNNTCTLTNSQVLQMAFMIIGFDMSSSTSGMGSSSMGGYGMINNNIFTEMINNDDLIASQYDVLAGNLISQTSTPSSALLVLDKNNELDDYLLYALGLITDSEMETNLHNIVYEEGNVSKIDYSSIIGKKYKIITESDYFIDIEGTVTDIRIFGQAPTYFTPNEQYDLNKYNTYLNQVYANATNYIEIVGIVRTNENTKNGSLSNGIVYTSRLTESMIDYQNSSIGVTSNKMKEVKKGTPESILIYVNAFESKEYIQNFIEEYNNQAEKEDLIDYTDYVGIIMGSVSTIINSITYVLISFVSVSLVVSSIMIAIITYISVLERTKEIGVLRSIGASKKDVRNVFTAESFIIGLLSGLMGIGITILLNIPINIILNTLTGLGNIAVLPTIPAIILVVISVVLTLIAGFIPSRMAAKKDPVIALRTE